MSASNNINPAIDLERQALAYFLSRVGIALCVVFVTVVVATAIPLRILDPAWQLRLVSALISHGAIALVGFVLILSAPSLHFASGRLRRRRDRVAQLAIAASFGYLLVIPLQGVAQMRGFHALNQSQSLALRRGVSRIEEVRKAVSQARSTSELQARLLSLQAPLPPLDVSRPIEVIRPQLLGVLKVTEATLRKRTSVPPGERLWSLIQEFLRVSFAAISFALAFACGARWPGHPQNLFDVWLDRLNRSRKRVFSGLRIGRASTRESSKAYLKELGASTPDQPKE